MAVCNGDLRCRRVARCRRDATSCAAVCVVVVDDQDLDEISRAAGGLCDRTELFVVTAQQPVAILMWAMTI